MSERSYRRVPPLYWLVEDERPLDKPLDARRFGLSTNYSQVFCFFSSEDYAWRWLKRRLEDARAILPGGATTLTGEPVSLDDWAMRSTDDADRLLAVCDEAALVRGGPRDEGFSASIPYDGFLIDPPLWLSRENPLPLSLEDMKAKIRQKAKEGTPWRDDDPAPH